MQDFTWKNTIADTKRTLRFHHCIGIEIWRKYLNGITLIESTQADLEKPLRHTRSTCFPDPRIMHFNRTKDICRTSHGKTQLPIQKGHYVFIIKLELKYGENI